MKYFILFLNIVQYLIVMQNTVITDRNNIELSSDSDSRNEVYNINNINHRNNILLVIEEVVIVKLELLILVIVKNYNIVTSNLMNSSSW